MNRYSFSLLFGAVLVLPFVLLEGVNRRGFPDAFPFALFGVLWLLSAAFVLVLTLVVQDIRAGNGVNPMGLVLPVASLLPLAGLWVGLVLDQLPCFLGVPNCD